MESVIEQNISATSEIRYAVKFIITILYRGRMEPDVLFANKFNDKMFIWLRPKNNKNEIIISDCVSIL